MVHSDSAKSNDYESYMCSNTEQPIVNTKNHSLTNRMSGRLSERWDWFTRHIPLSTDGFLADLIRFTLASHMNRQEREWVSGSF